MGAHCSFKYSAVIALKCRYFSAPPAGIVMCWSLLDMSLRTVAVGTELLHLQPLMNSHFHLLIVVD